jgi:hypothetical protein
LLEVGLHPMTLDDLDELCVAQFYSSTTREEIFNTLTKLVGNLSKVNIDGDLWIDGSFLTKKTNPADVDVVLVIDNNAYEQANEEQEQAIKELDSNDWSGGICDSYILVVYDSSDALYWFGEYMRAYWIRQFGFSRGEDMKGIATVTIPPLE